MTIGRLNALPDGDLLAGLRACCASTAWADRVAAVRPYADPAALHRASMTALTVLTWEDVLEALAAHPRIGERVRGAGREASWSRGEQSGAAGAGDAVRGALADGNRAYEARFDHVYLVCATGLSAEAMLAALTVRLGNDASAERAVVRAELAKITALRLAELAGGPA